jgi:hypothetical protein
MGDSWGMGWETNRREALSATMSGSLAKSKANLLPPRARFSFWWQARDAPYTLKNLQKILAPPHLTIKGFYTIGWIVRCMSRRHASDSFNRSQTPHLSNVKLIASLAFYKPHIPSS